jgi:hypothetical protein
MATPSTPRPPLSARGVVGKALLASGLLMALFGLGIATGRIAPGLEPRGLVAGALFAAAALDVMIGLRFLGERDS